MKRVASGEPDYFYTNSGSQIDEYEISRGYGLPGWGVQLVSSPVPPKNSIPARCDLTAEMLAHRMMKSMRLIYVRIMASAITAMRTELIEGTTPVAFACTTPASAAARRLCAATILDYITSGGRPLYVERGNHPETAQHTDQEACG